MPSKISPRILGSAVGTEMREDLLGHAHSRCNSCVRASGCCAQRTGMHIMVVEALLIAIYLGDELLLIDIRKPFQSRTCLIRYSCSLTS